MPVTKKCKGFPEGTCEEIITDHSKNHMRKYCTACFRKKYLNTANEITKKNKVKYNTDEKGEWDTV